MNSPTKMTNTSIKSYLILLISVTLVTYLIYLLLIPALTPPQAPLDVYDIVYLEPMDNHSYMKFINADGSNAYTRDVTFSVPRAINILGLNIPLSYQDIENQVSTVTWSPGGRMLAFTYPVNDGIFLHPGIITSDGEILICPLDDSLYTYFYFPVQIIDQERIVINIGSPLDNTNYLSLYNMRECKQESVYYDGDTDGAFSISSKGWLAIAEGIDDKTYIVIHEEQQKIFDYFQPLGGVGWIEWSKDGNQLLYIDTNFNSSRSLFSYDVQTRKVTTLGTDICCASFSPDGEKIVFQRDGQIYIRDLQTGQETYLSEGTAPQWRPLSD